VRKIERTKRIEAIDKANALPCSISVRQRACLKRHRAAQD
jgi:hypothetical protein